MGRLNDDRFHLAVVLPSDQKYYELYQGLKNLALSTYDWLTVTSEQKFDRSLFENKDQGVVFFGPMPPWVPLVTEAKIALYFMGNISTQPNDSEEDVLYYRKWTEHASRADLIFARDPYQRDRLQHQIELPVYAVPPAFYHPLVMGVPDFRDANAIQAGRKYGVITIGPETGRRKRIIDVIKGAPGLARWFTSFPPLPREERIRVMNQANAVLHIKRCDLDPTPDPFFASEVLGTTAGMLFEGTVTHPIDGDNGGETCQLIRDFEEGRSGPLEYITMYASSPQNGHRMAKKAYIKHADHMFHVQKLIQEMTRHFPD